MNLPRLVPYAMACAMAGTTCASDSIDFRTHILPVLTKAGCNTGSCHGSAAGQGGFRLSLLGYDPVQDHQNITRELGGRRLDLTSPANSLVLRKPTDELDHEGGRRIKRDSEAYRLLTQWIGDGASYGDAELRVSKIEVEPADILLPSANITAQLRVTATLSDGRREDVSLLALYDSNDDAVADVSSSGLVTTRSRGLTSIMVRYSGQVVAARIGVPFSDESAATNGFTTQGFIDDCVLVELQRLRLPPSPLSDDAEFFRRVHLDLVGRLPEIDEVRAFLQQPPSTDKRQRLIASLLKRTDFTDYWTLKFADWLLMSDKRGSETRTRIYHDWLHDQIANNRPIDQMAHDLLLGHGDPETSGPANFRTLAADPRDFGELVSSIFLGTQIACARCHAHPADRWTQDDYHAFAACFAGRDEVLHPKTARPVAPRALAMLKPLDPDTPLPPLADWLVSRDNALFARNWVNRVWKQLLGRGLVEPVDDLRPTNPPSHPALLDALAAGFTQHDFDLRWLVGVIAESQTYQLSSQTTSANRLDESLFSHALVKPLPAQVLADAIAQVTGVPDQFQNHPAGTRAVQLVGAQTPSYALDVLGRCSRERSCESPQGAGGGLAQALHLINGSSINDKLSGPFVTGLLSRGASNRELVDELYLRTLSRAARADEHAQWEPLLDQATDRAEVVEDLLWTLLNSREFAFNH